MGREEEEGSSESESRLEGASMGFPRLKCGLDHGLDVGISLGLDQSHG